MTRRLRQRSGRSRFHGLTGPVAFLRERLKPAVPADAQRVRELVRRLDSPRFAERQQAAQELEALADLAVTEMRA